jgi:hypothetical protein
VSHDLLNEFGGILGIVYRDPWSRLLSGFMSKFVNTCNLDYKMFRSKYMGTLDLAVKTNPLQDYFVAIVKAADHKLNEHFIPQRYQCLSQRFIRPMMSKVALVGVELSTDMNMISALLNHHGPDSYSNALPGSYEHTSSLCYEVGAAVVRRLAAWLQTDYDVINDQFQTRYDSEEQLKMLLSSSTLTPSSTFRICPGDSRSIGEAATAE